MTPPERDYHGGYCISYSFDTRKTTHKMKLNQIDCIMLAVAVLLYLPKLHQATIVERRNDSCTKTIQNFLAKTQPEFIQNNKSLLVSIDIKNFNEDCRTSSISVELWRVIKKPKIYPPQDFGSLEYFLKDQHCEVCQYEYLFHI